MSANSMLLNKIPAERQGDVYVGLFSQKPFWWSKTPKNDYVFEERRPFDALRVTCLFAQSWQESIKAEGLFWVHSQPSVAFRLRIENGDVVTRPAGKWLATLSRQRLNQPSTYEKFADRKWDSIYGDRIQMIAFNDTGQYQTYLQDSLYRCLVADQQSQSVKILETKLQ